MDGFARGVTFINKGALYIATPHGLFLYGDPRSAKDPPRRIADFAELPSLLEDGSLAIRVPNPNGAVADTIAAVHGSKLITTFSVQEPKGSQFGIYSSSGAVRLPGPGAVYMRLRDGKRLTVPKRVRRRCINRRTAADTVHHGHAFGKCLSPIHRRIPLAVERLEATIAPGWARLLSG